VIKTIKLIPKGIESQAYHKALKKQRKTITALPAGIS
tara:strand:+ start:914 stop:1024 length:111 start_codon:yes stop_codon:yes gene_type:complete